MSTAIKEPEVIILPRYSGSTPAPFKEKRAIANMLDSYHSLFRLFWDYGNIEFDNRFPTAWVEFDRKRGSFIAFKFNKKFWDSLDEYNRAFVCAHEMMHIFFKHGERGKEYKDEQVKNQAMDIVVNHYLVDQFKFKRQRIKNQQNYCWIDTLFKPEEKVEKDKTFDYYYDLLLKKKEEEQKSGKDKGKGGGKGQTVDIHGTPDGKGMENMSEQEAEQVDGMLEKFVKNLSEEEKKEFIREFNEEVKKLKEQEQAEGKKPGGKQAGSSTGFWSKLNVKRKPYKRKWESVIKRWDKMVRKPKEIDVDRWDRKNRRFEQMLKGNDFFLPTEVTMEDMRFKEKRIGVIMALDTSGSTYHLAERFFQAARTLDPKVFDVRLFCWDTAIEETSLKSGKVYGGGGTDASIIEPKIKEIMKASKMPYPKAVFVITDGCFSPISVEKPKNWHWFLCEGGTDGALPAGTHKYWLKDYE